MKTKKYQIPKREKYLISIIFLISIIILGMILNMTVFKYNGYKMPVKGCCINSEEHISFYYLDEINYEVLSDIIKIPLKTSTLWVSIGDILMFISYIIFFFFIILYLKDLHRDRKIWKALKQEGLK